MRPLRRAERTQTIYGAGAPKGWIAQRGGHDCMISALATAMDATYEETAMLFGMPCDPVSGEAVGIDKGMLMFEIGAPLLRHGWHGTVLFCYGVATSREGLTAEATRVMVSKPELAALLAHRRAVLQVAKEGPDGLPVNHFVAWRDGIVIDSSDAGFAVYGLDDIRVFLAMVLADCRGLSASECG